MLAARRASEAFHSCHSLQEKAGSNGQLFECKIRRSPEVRDICRCGRVPGCGYREQTSLELRS